MKSSSLDRTAGNGPGYWLIATSVLALLLFRFGGYLQTNSFDLVQHFLLVDEIMKHGGVRPPPLPMGTMAYYPPAAHWMAAVVGWIGGSGLVGITLVAIVSLFVSYLLILKLVDDGRLANVVLLTGGFAALYLSRSLIGWEIVVNFFYPQLVADVIYFAALLWVARNQVVWQKTAIFLGAGIAAMWVQPLVAIHILAAWCSLLAFQFVERWKQKEGRLAEATALLIAAAAASALIVALHPAFRVMRMISANDGYLDFGYRHIMLTAILCGVVGLLNLWRRLSGRAQYVDAILGSAVVAAVGLTVLQFATLKLHGDGSAYAVKKHMFIVLTLGLMNVVRLIGSYGKMPASMNGAARLLSPLSAGAISFVVLHGFQTPALPILNAMAYANHAASFGFPGFVPGNTVADDSSQSIMAKVMISLSAFQHPFDARAIGWQGGASVKDGAAYTMVKRTPDIDRKCSARYAESAEYVIVEPTCLKLYLMDQPLLFVPSGNAWQYASNGWSSAEPWGTWSLGNVGAEIVFNVPSSSKGPYQLIATGRAYVTPAHPSQAIVVEVNGADVATWWFSAAAPVGERSTTIPADLVRNGQMHIVFKAPGAVSPAQIGQSPDARVLGLGLSSLTVRTARE